MNIKQEKPANATETFKFFTWAYKNGDKIAQDLDYVPLPDNVMGAVEKLWGQVTDMSGKPVAIK
jgi:phosphate transport system substrate-binding protein